MNAVNTIVCPVDFSETTPRQVGLAADLCRLFRAQLVLHHNIAALAPGMGVGWMWSADHPPLTKDEVRPRLTALAAEKAPGLEVAVSITEGPASAAVREVSEAVKADLIVISAHHTTDAYTSISDLILEDGKWSVLALHDAAVERNAFGFDLSSGHKQVTLVPTDLTPESHAAVDFAFELARTLPLELHLLHLVPHSGRRGQTAAELESRLRALIPDDFPRDTSVHVQAGDPAQGIVRAAGELSAMCIVMGEHTRAPLRRWLSRDTSRGVLHDAPCPVWYVPGQAVIA